MAKRKGRKAKPSFLDQVNQTTVTAELLGELLTMHAELPAEDRGVFEVRAIRMFEFLEGKGLAEDDIHRVSMAVEFRLQALARLAQSDALRGWSLPGVHPGLQHLHPDLLRAAAEEPLIEDANKQATFDPDGFRRRVLEKIEIEGRG